MFGLPKLLEQDVMQSTLFTVISLTYYPSENYLNIQNRALDVIIQSKFCLVMPMTQITLENVDYNVDCFENAFNSQKKIECSTVDSLLKQVFYNYTAVHKGFDREKFKQLLELCARD